MTTASDQPMGHVEPTDGGWRLRFERRLVHAPAKVWRALTESEHLQHWMPVDIVGERRAGATLALPFWPAVVAAYDGATPTLSGEILVWDPPRTFEWRWDTEVLRFELAPIDGGTLLTFTTVVGNEPPAWSAAAGYHVCLGQLVALLDDGGRGSVMDVDNAPFEAYYRTIVEA